MENVRYRSGRIPERGKRKTCGTGAAEDRKNDPQGSGGKQKIGKAGNRTPRGERAGAADGLPERRRTKSERKACVGAAPGKKHRKNGAPERTQRRRERDGQQGGNGTQGAGAEQKRREKRKDAARRNGGKRTDGKRAFVRGKGEEMRKNAGIFFAESSCVLFHNILRKKTFRMRGGFSLFFFKKYPRKIFEISIEKPKRVCYNVYVKSWGFCRIFRKKRENKGFRRGRAAAFCKV